MVVVIVAEQDRVDGRELAEFHSGQAVPTGADERKGTAAGGPDGVRQDIRAWLLQQDGGVVDESGEERGRVDRRRRHGGLDWHHVRRGFTPAGEQPFNYAADAARAGGIRVKETMAVVMRWKGFTTYPHTYLTSLSGAA